MEPVGGTPDEYAMHLREETGKVRPDREGGGKSRSNRQAPSPTSGQGFRQGAETLAALRPSETQRRYLLCGATPRIFTACRPGAGAGPAEPAFSEGSAAMIEVHSIQKSGGAAALKSVGFQP